MAMYDRGDLHVGHGAPFDGGRPRMRRPVTDYGASMVQYMQSRKRGRVGIEQERNSPSYIIDMVPPIARRTKPADTIPVKHLHHSLNKIKHPINVVKWTPDGRRLLTGSISGEFTLWNGMSFNFETIMSAHDSAIRAATWSHSDDWLISADNDGIIKYWQPNFNNVKQIQGHEATIRDLAFSPTDTKFVSASDDTTLKVWDFAGGVEDSVIKGHGWDVKTVDWHPTKGLLVSGSKDHQIKLWDPRTCRCLTTLHGHKTTISATRFEPTNGVLLATSARDTTARIFDLRMMRDVLLLRGNEHDITTLAWHPFHSSFLSTGANNGALHHYLLDEPHTPAGQPASLSPYDTPDPSAAPPQPIHPAHRIPFAHESAIWSLAWHPAGHILASGSNDRVTRFWTRARPGDDTCLSDRYHLGEAEAERRGLGTRKRGTTTARDDAAAEEDDEADALEDQAMPARPSALPGLPGLQTIAPTAPSPDASNSNSAVAQMLHSFIPGGPAPAPAPAPPSFPQPTNGAAPPPLPLPPGMDMQRLQELMRSGALPPPPPLAPGQVPPPPPGFAFPQPAQGFPALGAVPGLAPSGIPGFGTPPPPPGMQMPVAGGGAESEAASARRRAPLPSQQDSLKEEMRRGNYRTAR